MSNLDSLYTVSEYEPLPEDTGDSADSTPDSESEETTGNDDTEPSTDGDETNDNEDLADKVASWVSDASAVVGSAQTIIDAAIAAAGDNIPEALTKASDALSEASNALGENETVSDATAARKVVDDAIKTAIAAVQKVNPNCNYDEATAAIAPLGDEDNINYTLANPLEVVKTAAHFDVDGTTKTTLKYQSASSTAGYDTSDGGKTYTRLDAVAETTLFNVTGLTNLDGYKIKLTGDGDTKTITATKEETTITLGTLKIGSTGSGNEQKTTYAVELNQDALPASGTVALTGTNSTLTLNSAVVQTPTSAEASFTTVTNGSAKYMSESTNINDYWGATGGASNSYTFHAAQPQTELFTLSGLKSGATLTADMVDNEKNTLTLGSTFLPGAGDAALELTNATGNTYTLAIENAATKRVFTQAQVDAGTAATPADFSDSDNDGTSPTLPNTPPLTGSTPATQSPTKEPPRLTRSALRAWQTVSTPPMSCRMSKSKRRKTSRLTLARTATSRRATTKLSAPLNQRRSRLINRSLSAATSQSTWRKASPLRATLSPQEVVL